MWSRSNNNLVSGRSRKNARYIGSTNRRAAPRPIGPMKLRRCPLGELVGHDLSQELADAIAGLRLIGENLVEGAIDVLIHSQSHQLSHEGGPAGLKSARNRLRHQATQQAVSGGGREWRRSSAP